MDSFRISDIYPQTYLWKFISLDDNQTPSWQQRLAMLVTDGQAWFSSPDEFNDPFDCALIADIPVSAKLIRQNAPTLIKRMIDSIGELHPDKDILSEMTALLADIDPQLLLKRINLSMRSTASKLGVFCVSESVDSILMWSHYANNHTGIALRFNPHVKNFSSLGPFGKVKYQSQRPTVDAFFSDNPKTELMDALLIKADFWSYENEWRSIRPNEGRHSIPFDQNIVDSLVFGARCSAIKCGEVKAIIGSRPFSYLRAVGDYDTFRLRFFDA